MSSDYSEIKSRADFDRALEQARRIAFGEQCERFADPEWKSILTQLDAMKRCTVDGRTPAYSERLGIDLRISAQRSVYAQTADRDDISKQLLQLENYFKNWPENAKPNKAETKNPLKAEVPANATVNNSAGVTVNPVPKVTAKPAGNSASPGAEKAKSSQRGKRFLLNNSRAAAIAPLLVAFAIYWAFHRIAPKDVSLAKIAAVLLAASLSWLALFTLYAFCDFLRGFFVYCPRCHRRLGTLSRCRCCGLPRVKMGK
jgi:hypothetical protein